MNKTRITVSPWGRLRACPTSYTSASCRSSVPMKSFPFVVAPAGKAVRGLLLVVFCFGLPAWTHAQGQGQGQRQAQPEARKTQKASPEVLAAFRPVVVKPNQSTVRIQLEGKDIA